jgi:hypothetical protein
MEMVSRSGWGAAPPRSVTSLNPSSGLAVHWNGPPMRLTSHSSCAGAVKGIQAFHMGPQRKWADIAYNFISCPHGTIYEGRGWGRRSAANGTNVGNSWGHAVMVMVGEGETVAPAVYGALGRLNVEHRRRYGRSSLRTHGSFKSTACPGPTLSRWVRENPNPGTTTSSSVLKENDTMTPAQENRLLQAIAAGPARDGRVVQAEAVWGRRDPHFDDRKQDFILRQIARGVSSIASDVASLDPVGLTDAQVDGFARAIADGLDDRVARKVVELLGQRLK